MERIFYLSENKLYKLENGKVTELTAQRLVKYRQVMHEIHQRKDWKTSGAGARFAGTYEAAADESQFLAGAQITGIAPCGDGMIYTVNIDDVGGMYTKSADASDETEGHIFSSNDMTLYGVSVRDKTCAACVGMGRNEKHICLFTIPAGRMTELTEGDTCEEYPCYSVCANKLYFTIAGFARSASGNVAAVSSRSVASYDFASQTMDILLEDENTDYIHPGDDKDGNLYYIRRPYNSKPPSKSILLDIVLFPYRIVKAIGGFLNIFSMLFGGEPLNSNGRTQSKAKQKSEKELFINGNLVNAEESLRENKRSGEECPGIIPHSWELIRRKPDGTEECLRRGVMDYIVCEDGSIVISNGKALLRMGADGSEKVITKVKLADKLVVCDAAK